MATGNANFDTLLSTTLNNYRKQLTDNVFKDRPFWSWLTRKNRVRMLSGGVKIVEPLIYGRGQTGSYGEWDAITITPQSGLSAAEFPWRQLYATVAISGLEEAQNNGEEAIINLLEAKIMQAEETFKDGLNTMVWGDGTGNSGKDFLGLSALVGDNTTGPATVGNIVVADNTWWRSKCYDKTGATAANLRTYMTTAYNAASNGSDQPDAIFSNFDVYELYESLLIPNLRYSDVETANSGFTNLKFKNAIYTPDADAPANTVWGVNSKYITLVGHKDRWFKQSRFSDGLSAQSGGTATTVDARYSIITTYGNLTVRNRARHFKIYNMPVT